MLKRNRRYRLQANICQNLLGRHRGAILAITLPSLSKYSNKLNKGLTGLPEIYFIKHDEIGSDEVFKIVSPRAFNYLDAIRIPLLRKSRLLEAGFISKGKSEHLKSMELIDDSFRDKIVLIVSQAPKALLTDIDKHQNAFDVKIKTLKYTVRGGL